MKTGASILSLAVIAISMFFLVGYVAGDRRYYTLPNSTFTAVALPTAILFLMLGIATAIIATPPKAKRALRRLLLVDDEPNDRVLFRLAADRYFLVDEAGTLGEAETMVSRRHYDCVVLDLKLPDSADSGSTISQFLQRNPGAICVALSGAIEQASNTRIQGARDFIAKSWRYDPEALRATILSACRTNRHMN